MYGRRETNLRQDVDVMKHKVKYVRYCIGRALSKMLTMRLLKVYNLYPLPARDLFPEEMCRQS